MKLKDWLHALKDQLESWGVRLPEARGEAKQRVRIFTRQNTTKRVIGTLWQDNGEFVFKYDHAYAHTADSEPITAFPDLDEEYRSRELWPFFAIRIPPTERSDVRELLSEKRLRPDQTLKLLGALGQRSISNPYQLEFVETTDRDSIPPSSGGEAHAA